MRLQEANFVSYATCCPPPVSSLLQSPHRLEALVAGLVEAVGGRVPVSVKMRSGFEDTSLFEDNLLAIQVRGNA
jgi:tRNA-dihydrouridine synthase C